LIIPQLILQLRGCYEPLTYHDLDSDTDLLNIDKESFTNVHYLNSGFLTVPDEDGEQNYIPISNIECMEVSRVFIYADDIWHRIKDSEEIMDSEN